MAAKIKKGDTVIVLTGRSKGQTGKILKVDKEKDRVFVEGAQLVSRHLKPSALNPDGGIVKKEASIHVSNVAFWDEEAKRGSRVGFKVEEKGQKVRYLKRSGREIKD